MNVAPAPAIAGRPGVACRGESVLIAARPEKTPRQPIVKSGPRGAGTVQRIITVAERLFGDFGIEAVSLRQIRQEAGASNKSAIAYHFGDRESLVQAILKARLPDLELDRASMLASIIAEGRDRDPAAIFALLFLPSYRPVDEEGRHRYAAFLRQALRWQPGLLLRHDNMTLTPSSASAIIMLRRIYADLPDYLFNWRLSAASALFFDQAHSRGMQRALGLPILDQDAFISEAIQMCVACLSAPVTVDPSTLPATAPHPYLNTQAGTSD